MTKTFKEVIAGIRTAIYGREVREDIAQMGEYVEQFANTATTKASEAASSATAAKNSQTAAKTSETNAAASQKAAASSASAAASSASAAKISETNAGKSQQAAASSASAAASSASAAKSSETAAAGSASAAKQSETNSASSAAAAKESQTASATSEKNAADSKAAAEQALADTQQAKTDALTDISAARSTALTNLSIAEETALSNVADATKTSTANAATAAQKAADAAQSAADALAHQQAAATSEGNAASSAAAAKASEERAAELASERVAWDNITGKPEAYPPSSHKHTKAEITDFPASMPASDVPAWAKAQTKPSYAWGEITGKPSAFTPASHTHDLSALINALSTGTSTPVDADYYVSQYVGGGTNAITYHRRPMSALWAYIKGKADSLYQAKGSYAASNHNHDSRYYTESEVDSKFNGKLSLTGGAMTGNIKYTGSKATHDMISFIDNKNDAYGNGIAIGGGGATIVGGGESAAACVSLLPNGGGDEQMILANDGAIDIYTNCQNGVSKATHVTIDNSGVYSGKAKTAGTADIANSVAWGNVTGKPSTFAPASHTHNYAGSGSAGGSANSAVKLDSSAGSSTQPVYFSGGKPVACSFSINNNVNSFGSNMIRFDCNIQICWTMFTGSTTSWTFPAAFKDANYAIVTGDSSMPTSLASSKTTTSVSLSYAGNGTNLIAIGLWR